MEITINEKNLEVPDYTTLQGALNIAGIDPTDIITALNGEVIPLVDRDAAVLQTGDKVQVIEPL
ncbi:MAG: sulfur carrier protein ThiS [Muribaculum sp.]|nr:sulfur carrier protein ThiS [Muribaculaceae bacterium]MCM1080936.1 sulfur carrier protein ThiS [Muribaculum sp.]